MLMPTVLLTSALGGQTPTARSALARYDFRARPALVQAMPPKLRELSGLAILPDQSWIAHNDEEGVLYRRGASGGAWRPWLAFDRDERRGDFEAVVLADGWLWLQQSDGRRRGHALQQQPSVSDRRQLERAPCEVEALIATADAWWAPCKRAGRAGGVLTVRQPRDGGRWQAGWRITARQLAAAGLPSELGISDALVDAATGHWLLVAGPERILLEVTPAGTMIASIALDRARHPQPEALALRADGTLLIGDEGARVGTVVGYAPVRAR